MADVPRATVILSRDWRVMSALLSPSRVHADIEREMKRATNVNARLVVAKARRVLQSRMAPPNAALTLFIKQPKDKPGVDSGELFKAITKTVLSPWAAEVGVLKGDEQANTAVIVHEGTRIPVTNKMRAMFEYLYRASAGRIDPSALTGRAAELWKRQPGGWKKLNPSTTHIKIPPRRYIKAAIEDAPTVAAIGENWSRAFAAGLAGVRATLITRA